MGTPRRRASSAVDVPVRQKDLLDLDPGLRRRPEDAIDLPARLHEGGLAGLLTKEQRTVLHKGRHGDHRHAGARQPYPRRAVPPALIIQCRVREGRSVCGGMSTRSPRRTRLPSSTQAFMKACSASVAHQSQSAGLPGARARQWAMM